MKIKYSHVEDENREKIDKLFGVENCLIEVNPGKILIPPKFEELGERILNLDVRPDDVWLASYPRTGSTWAQEIVWCLTNNLDYEGAKLLSQMRAPLLELTALFGNDKREWKNMLTNSVEQVENMQSPRCIKTHLPWDLLPIQLKVIKPKTALKGFCLVVIFAKFCTPDILFLKPSMPDIFYTEEGGLLQFHEQIVYVARNPKDCSVSYYHYCQLIHDFHGTYEDFCELFLQGKAHVGSMWEHVREFWRRRDEPNIIFLKYENMKKNQLDTVKKLSQFLGKNYTDEELENLVDHASFSKMSQNPATNLEPILEKMYDSEDRKSNIKFIRKGQVGDWKNHMSNESADKFDKLSEKLWSSIGLTFDH